jgi:hypothetical protein
MLNNISETSLNNTQRLKLILAFIVLGLIFVNAGCSEYDSGVGSGVVDGMRHGIIKEDSLLVNKNATYFEGDYIGTQTPALMFGRQNGLESQLFLKFDLSLLPDSIVDISDVKIKLYGNGFIDSTTAQSSTAFNASIHMVTAIYSPIEFNYHSVFEDTVWTDVSVPIGTTEMSDSVEFDFSIPTLQSWIDDSLYGVLDADTAYYGMILKPDENSTFIKKFVPALSTENDKYPKMLVTLSYIDDEDNAIDSLFTIKAKIARYLVNDTVTEPDGSMILSKGFIRRMMLEGDFARFNANSISINRVELVLHADTSWSDQFINDNDVFNFSWRDILEEWNEDSAVIDSTGGTSILAYSISADTIMIRINITPKVSQWVLNPESNFGVEIWPYTSRSSFSRMAFFNRESEIVKYRPYFHVIYTEYEE